METGIKKKLGITDQEIQSGTAFVTTLQRRPGTYGGVPFIIEVGLASSKQIEMQGKILLFRFANKIPLLFDEASDVSWKVVDTEIDGEITRSSRVKPRSPFSFMSAVRRSPIR